MGYILSGSLVIMFFVVNVEYFESAVAIFGLAWVTGSALKYFMASSTSKFIAVGDTVYTSAILNPPYNDLIAQLHDALGKETFISDGMLSRVDANMKIAQVLWVCPTREMSVQMLLGSWESIPDLFLNVLLPCMTHIIFHSINAPVTSQVVIGTPPSIKRWISAKKLKVKHVKMIVLDEVDKILAEDGLKDDILRIMREIGRDGSHFEVHPEVFFVFLRGLYLSS
ncbi:hypothetical protein DITRI_Ditri03aG0167600 [Diplodiscus trichospermus]